jgi:hypothetical protein
MSAKMNQKMKRNNLPAGLDKVGGFIEAQGFNPGNLRRGDAPSQGTTTRKAVENENDNEHEHD